VNTLSNFGRCSVYYHRGHLFRLLSAGVEPANPCQDDGFQSHCVYQFRHDSTCGPGRCIGHPRPASLNHLLSNKHNCDGGSSPRFRVNGPSGRRQNVIASIQTCLSLSHTRPGRSRRLWGSFCANPDWSSLYIGNLQQQARLKIPKNVVRWREFGSPAGYISGPDTANASFGNRSIFRVGCATT
jgi:hypothetical protein